jgi:hypothetical protein
MERKDHFEKQIYRTTIIEEKYKCNTYTGLTCNKFETRWDSRKHSFNVIDAFLSSHMHNLN